MYNIRKTLFVSDLDGTLLRSDGKLSDFSLATINKLIASGMNISFATARSLYMAQKVIGDVDQRIPLILHNGAFIQRPSGEYLRKSVFTVDEVNMIKTLLDEYSVEPIVYSIHDEREIYRFDQARVTPEEQRFLDARPGDPRKFPVGHERLWEDHETIFYVTCIGRKDHLLPAYEKLSGFTVIFQPDFYSKDQWLEILPENSGKAQATKALSEALGCDRIVVFGDAENDLSNFGLADEAYAVANAVDQIKNAATAIIGSNDEDGVAKFLLGAFEDSV